MSTAHIIAQLCMLATLILMITGKTPIYMTAIVGAAISALIAGFPMAGGTGMTVTKMIVSGLNPVIADMTLQVVKRSLKAQKRSRHFS